jgi:hypothetical protein
MDARAIASGFLIIVALVPVDAAVAAAATCHVVGTVRHTLKTGGAQKVTGDVSCSDGDLLEAIDATSRMVLRCSARSELTFENGFRAFIVSVAPGVCAINLRDGNAAATTPPEADEACEPDKEPGPPKTRIETANAVTGACGTRFGVEVTQERISAAYVVEGTAVLRRTAGGSQLIKSGTELHPDDNKVTEISDARLRSLARTYAVLSQSETGAPISPDSQQKLQAAYYAALKQPYNPGQRAALIEVQRAAQVRGAAQGYDFVRADRLVKASNDPALKSRWSMLMKTTAVVPTSKRFDYPRHNGYRVDICRIWGGECHQPAADEWCRTRGYASAASFKEDPDVGAKDASITIGSGQVCGEPFCDAFRWIDCRLPVKPANLTFPNPKHLGIRLDICLHWGVDCGQPTADAWCTQQGFERATGLTHAQNVGQTTPTIVMGDAKVCALPECDAFASITCTR